MPFSTCPNGTNPSFIVYDMKGIILVGYDFFIAARWYPVNSQIVNPVKIHELLFLVFSPVVVVSADQSRQTVEEFQRLRAGAIISKGEFKRGKLINVIKELLGDV